MSARMASPRAGVGPVAGAGHADDAAQAPLAGMACFDLYAAHRAMTGVYRSLLEPVGLTYPQYLVLCVLWDRGTATVGAIRSEVDLDYGTMSPLLKRLETRGGRFRRAALSGQQQCTQQQDRGHGDFRGGFVRAWAGGERTANPGKKQLRAVRVLVAWDGRHMNPLRRGLRVARALLHAA